MDMDDFEPTDADAADTVLDSLAGKWHCGDAVTRRQMIRDGAIGLAVAVATGVAVGLLLGLTGVMDRLGAPGWASVLVVGLAAGEAGWQTYQARARRHRYS